MSVMSFTTPCASVSASENPAYPALISEPQVAGCYPARREVAGSIPGWDIYLGCGFLPVWAHVRGDRLVFLSVTLMSLSFSFSLPSSLSKNK